MRAIFSAVDAQLHLLHGAVPASLLESVEQDLRLAVVRAYISALLLGTAKLPASADSEMASDITEMVEWVEASQSSGDRPLSRTKAKEEPSVELTILDGLLSLVGAEASEFAEAHATLQSNHPGTPLLVAERILARRPELSKSRKALLAACQSSLVANETADDDHTPTASETLFQFIFKAELGGNGTPAKALSRLTPRIFGGRKAAA